MNKRAEMANQTSEQYFDSAIKALQKPQEPRRLLKIVVAIRKEMEWPVNRANMLKFHSKGCLKHIVPYLQEENCNILDTILSILGNCCMERVICRDLVNIVSIVLCSKNIRV